MRSTLTVILILVSVGLALIFVKPMWNGELNPAITFRGSDFNIAELRFQIEEYQSVLARTEAAASRRDELNVKKQIIEASGDSDKLTKIAPPGTDLIRLIIDVNGVGQRHGMPISSISVSKISSGEEVEEGRPLRATSKQNVEMMEISFIVAGPYETFLSFLADLERSLRIFDVSSLSVSSLERGSAYEYKLSLKTYSIPY